MGMARWVLTIDRVDAYAVCWSLFSAFCTSTSFWYRALFRRISRTNKKNTHTKNIVSGAQNTRGARGD